MDKTVSGPDSENESVQLSVRKINNGYVLCESHSKGDDYTYTETYSEVRPVLGESAAPATPMPPNSMQRAIAMMNKGKK